jgi:hypothetical protein
MFDDVAAWAWAAFAGATAFAVEMLGDVAA